MLIFKFAKEGTLQVDGLMKIADCCDVTAEGVSGAKSFFEAKVIISFSKGHRIVRPFTFFCVFIFLRHQWARYFDLLLSMLCSII